MSVESEHIRKRPAWLRVKALSPTARQMMASALSGLHTVCEEANCPNIGECYARGTATFMIMGNVCTRKCSFCAVATGAPGSLNPHEPELLADSVVALGLRHVVITSVNRDDLPDGGASHFAKCIRALRSLKNPPTIEVLTPDFQGDKDALYTVLKEFPEVFNHNVETVPRLYREVRVGAHYEWSILQLRRAREFAESHPFPTELSPSDCQVAQENSKSSPIAAQSLEEQKKTKASAQILQKLSEKQVQLRPRILIKSGLMLGLGETLDEVVEVMMDLRDAGVDFITIGQYLKPLNDSTKHEVVRYAPPEEFEELAEIARDLGFLGVASGPLVRSSYFAEHHFSLLKSAE